MQIEKPLKVELNGVDITPYCVTVRLESVNGTPASEHIYWKNEPIMQGVSVPVTLNRRSWDNLVKDMQGEQFVKWGRSARKKAGRARYLRRYTNYGRCH